MVVENAGTKVPMMADLWVAAKVDSLVGVLVVSLVAVLDRRRVVEKGGPKVRRMVDLWVAAMVDSWVDESVLCLGSV